MAQRANHSPSEENCRPDGPLPEYLCLPFPRALPWAGRTAAPSERVYRSLSLRMSCFKPSFQRLATFAAHAAGEQAFDADVFVEIGPFDGVTVA